jgi:hypothetical protein
MRKPYCLLCVRTQRCWALASIAIPLQGVESSAGRFAIASQKFASHQKLARKRLMSARAGGHGLYQIAVELKSHLPVRTNSTFRFRTRALERKALEPEGICYASEDPKP